MNKSGIQLSVNFIVILIIAVFVFGLGLRFAYKIFVLADEMKENLDRETEAQIEMMLDTGAIVGIPINRAKLGIGDSKIFGLGINNDGDCENFEIKMDFTTAVDTNGDFISELAPEVTNIDNWYNSEIISYTIAPFQNKKVPLLVHVKRTFDNEEYKTQRGTYAFTVEVFACTSSYGSTQKIYVEVI